MTRAILQVSRVEPGLSLILGAAKNANRLCLFDRKVFRVLVE